MPTQKKIFTVQNLVQKLKDAKIVVLADYQGLNVEQISNLRSLIKDAGGELEVVKNTLLKRAAAEAKAPIDDAVLAGPTAVLWAWEDEIAPLKVLDKFAAEYGSPQTKAGLLGDLVLTDRKIKELAALPPLPQLQAKLVGSLNAPVYGFVGSLQGNLRKLVWILKAVGSKKN